MPAVCRIIATALALGLGVGQVAAQQVPTTPERDSTQRRSGIGASYWGIIPPPADSVQVTTRPRPMPAWEGILVWPYRVVTLPIWLLSSGIGESVEYLDEKRVLNRLGKLLGPREGPFGVVLNFSAGGLPGLGGGVSLEHDAFFRPGHQFRLRGSATLRGHRRGSLGLRFPAGDRGSVEFGAGYRYRPNARYFGRGPNTRADDASFYGHELGWAGASYRRALGASVYLGGSALYSTLGTGPPRDQDTPPLAERFAAALPPGYDSRSSGVSLGLVLSHETADETGRPTGGGIHRFQVSYFRGLGDDETRFWTYRAEMQRFIRLWYRHNVLAIRGHATWIDPVGASVVPFQRLMTNDDPDLMRGFRDFRWRDRGLVVVSAEYRWPIWVLSHPEGMGLDMYLLVDAGQVFGVPRDIDLGDFVFSYGAGIRVLNLRGFVLRVEYARSGEEAVWRLRSDQLFQFARGGLFSGRDPVPLR